MRFAGGYLTIGSFRGAPVRVHWSTPLGTIAFGGLDLSPGRFLGELAGFFVIVLLHELGHAALVRRFGLRVEGIDIHAAGGECRWSGRATEKQAAIVAWGGVLAQAALLIATSLAGPLIEPYAGPVAHTLLHVFVVSNVVMIGLNLLPIGPLDGARAWRLFPILVRSARRRPRPVRRDAPMGQLIRLEDYAERRLPKEVQEALERSKRAAQVAPRD